MLNELTEAQQRAIQAQKDQPSLILAAAGSGKTLVLCHRILYFISQGVAAKNILAVTFSRRAGRDLLYRLHSVAAARAFSDSNVLLEGIHVSTFHSFCLSILRAFPTQAGLSSDFIVVTPKMQLQILEDLVRVWYDEKLVETEGRNSNANSPIDCKTLAEPLKRNGFHTEAKKLYQQLRKFESSKKSGSSLGNKKSDLERRDDLFEWVYERYQSALRSMDGIDFSEFPRLACKVLENCEPAFTATGLQAQYILGVVKSSGYKSLLEQKTARHSLRESYKLEEKHIGETISGPMKRLQSFIDHVSLKLHDGELGDCDGCSTPLRKDAGDTYEPEPMDSVVLSTVHQAKGLEWTAVILVRANEGILPLMDIEPPSEKVIPQSLDSGFHVNSNNISVTAGKLVPSADIQDGHTTSSLTNSSVDGEIIVLRDMSNWNAGDKCRDSVWESIEEERRLMYVALTRAKNFLLVTYVMLQGQQVMRPSRFLADIPKGLMRRTTCYDSNSEGMNRNASRKDIGGRSSDSNAPLRAIHEGLSSCKIQSNSAVKGADGSKFNGKGEPHSQKTVPKEAVDVTQSLQEIDDLLDSRVEPPALYRKPVYSTSKQAANRMIRTEGSKGFKRPRGRTCQVVHSSSEDSDFETPSKVTCKKLK